MSGIVFFGTEALDRVVDFYTDVVGATVWLEQPDCTILRYDSFLFGFCERSSAETDGTITFVADDREDVDDLYDRLESFARDTPMDNDSYRIYHFYADDPEGRAVEVQTFLHPTEPV